MDVRRRLMGSENDTDSKYMVVTAIDLLRIGFDGYGSGYYSGKLYWSYDQENWVELTSGNETGPLKPGESMYFKGNLRITDTPGWGEGFYSIMVDKSHEDYDKYQEYCRFNLSGNILALIYMDDADKNNSLLDENQFNGFFSNSEVVDVSKGFLPATNLTYACYDSMFIDCPYLKSAPDLPARTLTVECYREMFSTCYSLEYGPALPATNLDEYCYARMFEHCDSLKGIGSDLPAAYAPNQSYSYMFSGCESLEYAPAILATNCDDFAFQNMYQGCKNLKYSPDILIQMDDNTGSWIFEYMFANCISLTKSPVIRSHSKGESSHTFEYMFSGCSSLKEVRIMTSDLRAYGKYTIAGSTKYWLSGVPSGGVLYKHKNAKFSSDSSGCPSGWTMVDEYND
jgi:hypothetical protein